MPIVYKITNKITHKVYIGWTGSSIEKRWKTHLRDAAKNKDNRKFYNSIRKYGESCWDKEILFECDDKNDAKQKEIEYIAIYNSYENGYNATKGGDGNNCIIMSEESNRARSIALKGIPKSEATIAKFKQRRCTEEENKKRSGSHKGMSKSWVKWNKEQIEKRALTRRSLSKEQHQEIQNLRQKGLLLREIADELKIDYGIVKKWSRRKWELF
jgi:group I intron endonuclease